METEYYGKNRQEEKQFKSYYVVWKHTKNKNK